MTNTLPSERVVLAAPLSYVGSAKRIWKLTGPAWAWLLTVPLAVTLIVAAWTFVTAWYALFLLIWPVAVAWRLLRRSDRRRRMDDLRHREQLDELRQRRERRDAA